jgi:putative protease
MLSSDPAPTVSRPELLAPAGNWECARAAVANGADAIYFGMPRFNARLRADNFTEADLPALMTFLHQHGVKGYVAFNTLDLHQRTAGCSRAAEAARRRRRGCRDRAGSWSGTHGEGTRAEPAPTREHADDDHFARGLEFAKKLDIDQAVLARELSLRELERFKDARCRWRVFVHGALCVAYSGQCLTSESLGKRSANRGECAQACRMPYEMIVDGEKIDLGDKALPAFATGSRGGA